MNQALVSVIVPCYNYGHFIAETIQSLQAQSYTNWECIVVNDGSTDNSEEVVQALAKEDARIRYIYQENKGLPGARNTGIQNAKGNYLQFLDSDDLLQKRKLELQVKAFEENPDLELSYAGLRYFHDGKPDKLIYSSSAFNSPWHLQKSGKGNDLARYLVISCCIMPPMPLLKKSAMLEKVGLFTEDLKSCEDWEFWIRCALGNMNFSFLDAPETLALMRLHPSSMTKNRKVMIDSMIEVRNRIQSDLPNEELKKLNQNFLNNELIELCVEHQRFESFFGGTKKMWALGRQRKSIKMLLFSVFSVFAPHRFKLFILGLMRSFQKKRGYLK